VANTRPLPPSFDAVVVFIVTQAHLVSLITVWPWAGRYRAFPATLALLGLSLVVPLACVVTARWRGGGDLPLAAFVAASGVLLGVDVAVAATVRPAYIGTPAYWPSIAIGVTLLALCPYRPPQDLIVVAAGHALVIVAVLALHRDQPSVEPFAVIVHLSAAVIPAVAAAEFVRFYVRALRRRQDVVAEQARAQSRVTAAAAIQEDADRRLARLRTEVLPFLSDIAEGRRPVDDPQGAGTAQRLSADLRRELVEARSGAWLLSAPVAAFAGPSTPDEDGWPGIVLLDPQRLVGRLDSGDRAALSAVLAAVRGVGGWAGVSVAMSVTYPVDRATDFPFDRPGDHPGDGDGDGGVAAHGARRGGGPVAAPGESEAAFVTVVAHGQRALDAVDPAVEAAARRAGCTASLEPPSVCVVEGTLPLRGSVRLES
jgi:hypothetical protein